MGMLRTIGSALACICVVGLVTGCVGLDEHRRVEFALRKCQATNEELSRDLEDARGQVEGMRLRTTGVEGELGTQRSLAGSLREENRRLSSAYSQLQAEFDALVKKLGMPKPIVLERLLPAELDAAIKAFAAAHPDVVEYDDQRGVVKWKSDLLFALGSDVVKQSASEALSGFASIVNSQAAEEFEVIIVGHTDNMPIGRPATRAKHPTNWHLSAHRAIAVMNQLKQAGVAATRLGVMGYAEYRPVADNVSDDGRQKNRRVELFLVPMGSVGPTATAEPVAEPEAAPEPDSLK